MKVALSAAPVPALAGVGALRAVQVPPRRVSMTPGSPEPSLYCPTAVHTPADGQATRNSFENGLTASMSPGAGAPIAVQVLPESISIRPVVEPDPAVETYHPTAMHDVGEAQATWPRNWVGAVGSVSAGAGPAWADHVVPVRVSIRPTSLPAALRYRPTATHDVAEAQAMESRLPWPLGSASAGRAAVRAVQVPLTSVSSNGCRVPTLFS